MCRFYILLFDSEIISSHIDRAPRQISGQITGWIRRDFGPKAFEQSMLLPRPGESAPPAPATRFSDMRAQTRPAARYEVFGRLRRAAGPGEIFRTSRT